MEMLTFGQHSSPTRAIVTPPGQANRDKQVGDSQAWTSFSRRDCILRKHSVEHTSTPHDVIMIGHTGKFYFLL